MATFMTELMERFQAIDPKDIVTPSQPINKGEEVIDTVKDDDTKKFRVLCMTLADECNELAAEIDEAHYDGETVSNNRHDLATCLGCQQHYRLVRLKGMYDAADTLLWTSVKNNLSDEGLRRYLQLGSFGIREEWQVVAYEEQEETERGTVVYVGGADLLRKILGEG